MGLLLLIGALLLPSDQILLDGSFEAGTPNPFWTESSTNYLTPLCTLSDCGDGNGTAGPRTGVFWAWFGGTPGPETATLGQTVTIPSNVTATLTFWMRIGAVSPPFTDVLRVKVDGAVVQAFPEPIVPEDTYTLRSISLNAFADGAPHAILFEYVGTTDFVANFSVDDVELNTAALATVAPAALAVDSAGNGVLEANEAAAVVAPAWTNTSTVNIASLTGALTLLTGPAGPVYTITDPGARYGAVAAGAQASCTAQADCYAVTVASATRPAVHWDAAALEVVSVGPSAKTWALHVGGSFTDVPATSPFYRFVETLLHESVTGGCGTATYCPAGTTTREQMAVFVLVAKQGAGYVPPACAAPNLFADVPETSPFCRFVEELAARTVVTGCAPNLYCPSAPVTREQMAIFALRTLDPALDPPACVAGGGMFTDVPATSPFCRWIEELARRGVVAGCAPSLYCPALGVTREQMGVFLSVTFALTLYGV